MARSKRNLALLETPVLVEARVVPTVPLPATVEDLAGFELHSQCDRCGRTHRVYPSPQDLHPRMRLVDLIGTLLCRARRDGRTCAGRPRRVVLRHEDTSVAYSPTWTLEPSGEWSEDDTQFWEAADFAR